MQKIPDSFKILAIKEIERHGNQARAARAAGISRETIRRWFHNDKDFKDKYQKALAVGRG